MIKAMLFRPAVIGFIAMLGSQAVLADVALSSMTIDRVPKSVSSPLPSKYAMGPNGSVTLRICFHWSCGRRQAVTFTPDDIALLRRYMATCSGTALHDRLQQVRIGIWQMELLAEKCQPLLAQDLAINDSEAEFEGRMDCIDNASNTTTYLHVLKGIGELPGWRVSSPKVRNRFDLNAVHWTAVIIDTKSGEPWSVDSWFRPNGHLPMVMPLESWMQEKKAWEPPFDALNPTPRSIYDLCDPSRFAPSM